ncbi:MAG: hypothetical protein FWF25_07840 [Propionibacteriaceae bacterium]|nr:hypothetical protein [Propionibacteriaceae bacterium]
MATDVIPRQASQLTQATQVEQARAVEEVRAAVLVAQQCPRDLDQALVQMRESCAQLGLAERAFYSVQNRGTGITVHLARELARIWGNITYTVRELRRDDENRVSEIEVSAWDQQSNVRVARIVQVPHARMTKNGRSPLTDMTDIINNNNAYGARQLRECILAIVPPWFVEEAAQICRATLQRGNGQSVAARARSAIEGFAPVGITVAQLEARIGKPVDSWTAQDLGLLATDYTSVTTGGIDPATIFPDHRENTAALLSKRGDANTPRNQGASPNGGEVEALLPPASLSPSLLEEQ